MDSTVASPTVFLHGCVVRRDGSRLLAELVLTADAVVPPPRYRAFHLQQARLAPPVVSVEGWSCQLPVAGLHALTVQCIMSGPAGGRLLLRPRSPMPVPRSLIVALGGPVRIVGLRARQIRSSMMACTGRVVYGAMDARLRAHEASRAAWRRAGGAVLWVFAQTMAACAKLEAVEGTTCEVRGTADRVSDERTEHLYEQPVRHLLCLAYGRAAKADFLALADADDFPPPQLPQLLALAARHRPSLAGIRLFFDPDLACGALTTAGGCPASEADWKARCRPPRPPHAAPRKNHWKPIVMPNRTRDVAVHQFTAVAPYVRKQVWRLCFHHRHPPPSRPNVTTPLALLDDLIV